MKTKLFAFVLMAAGTLSAQVSVGIRLGPPPPPRVVRVLPRSPGPDYIWVAGYWYPVGRKYRWHDGYWTRPPYAGARWVGPRHDGERFFEGRWDGDRGHFNHDHAWDRERAHDRDYNRHNERGEDRRDRRD